MSSLMFLVICRKQQQQVDRGDFSPCGTPTGLDARDQFDLQLGRLWWKLPFYYLFRLCLCQTYSTQHVYFLNCMLLGGRMLYNTQDMLWRRKLEEQADLQQALELQSRRLMGLQLLDIKKHHQRALSTGSPIPSPTHSPNMFNQNIVPSFHINSESPKGISLSHF